MARVYEVANPKNYAECPVLPVVKSEVLDAYLATAEIEDVWSEKGEKVVYNVKGGDTFFKIAKAHKKTTAELRSYNDDITEENQGDIKVGQKIIVSEKKREGANIKFTKIKEANLGDEVYIVVETNRMEQGTVHINLLQGQEKVLEKKDKPVFVTFQGNETTLIKAEVNCLEMDKEKKPYLNEREYIHCAIAKIKLSPKTAANVKKWKDALDDCGDPRTDLYLLVDAHTPAELTADFFEYKGYKGSIDDSNVPNHFLNENNEWFTLKDSHTIHIYHDGKISEVDLKGAKKINYIYHDATGIQHEIGSFDVIEVQKLKLGKSIDAVPEDHLSMETIAGNREKYIYADRIVVKGTESGEANKIREYKKATGNVQLAKLKSSINYSKGDLTIKYKLKSGSTRPYIAPEALACVIGAIAEVGYSDITIVGFTSVDNHGYPSKTHVNGENGDFRYLRTDKTGGSLHINSDPSLLDVTRQELLIDAFIKFGWPKFYSVDYTINNVEKILKKSDDMVPHHHHLHSRLFEPSYK